MYILIKKKQNLNLLKLMWQALKFRYVVVLYTHTTYLD